VQIQTSEGLGSGIVFDTKGDIVTNDHVVGTAKSFTVTTSTGKILKGTLVGTFQEDDLAVIKVASSALKPATFADFSTVQVGDIAIAIGNPLGLASSVTEGIVSGLGRQEPEGNGVVLPSAIQTSAAINPGNSGGALVDLSGAVVGIPTLAATDPQLGGGAAPGIGFAIPSNTVRDIAGQMIANGGKVTNSHRAYLGVRVASVTGGGALITSVDPGGPAAKAGLKAGDVIMQINGQTVDNAGTISAILASLQPGQVAHVSVAHSDGSQATVDVTLGQLPGS
jgi:putative serine protease PepD